MQEKSDRTSNADRRAAMRARLIAKARALFVEKGYGETSTPEIVKAAGVTRGALYHHFDDKAALFDAVICAEAEALAAEIETASRAGPQEGLLPGSDGFFAAMAYPGRARLLLTDGPAVLGHARMQEIDAGNGQRSLREGLAHAIPGLGAAELEALAMVLSAGFDRAAQAIAQGEEAAPFKAALTRLMSGLAP